ncbi:MAG: hypothetical protein MUF34_11680 [Polyangiaceae bacterium]|nr:hypothetical protein [Polyangiaceae bacterium]
MAHRLEQPRDAQYGGAGVGVDVGERRLHREADAQAGRRAPRALGEGLRRGRCPVRGADGEAREHVEHGGGVVDAAGERPHGVEHAAIVAVEGLGHAPARGLEAVKVVERSGNAHRPRAVARLGNGHEAGGDRGGRAARRAASAAPEVPGVARGRVNVGLGDGHGAELGGRRLAEEDEAGAAQERDGRVVDRREQRRQRAGAEAGAGAAQQVQVFDADRHAEEERPRRRAAEPIVAPRLGERRVGRHLDERREGGVEPLDASEVELGELAARHLPFADQPGLFERRSFEKVGGGGHGALIPLTAFDGRLTPTAQ